MGIAIYNPMNLKVLNILKPSFLSFSLCACLFKKICNTECWPRFKELELPFAGSRNVNWYDHRGKRLDSI